MTPSTKKWWTWFGRIQNGVDKYFRLTRAQDEHASLLNRTLGRSLCAMNHEIRHRSALQIGGALDEKRLVRIEPDVNAVGLRA